MDQLQLIAVAENRFEPIFSGCSIAEACADLDSGTNDPVAQLVADWIESAMTNIEPNKRAAFLADRLAKSERNIGRIARAYATAARLDETLA